MVLTAATCFLCKAQPLVFSLSLVPGHILTWWCATAWHPSSLQAAFTLPSLQVWAQISAVKTLHSMCHARKHLS